MSTNVVLRSKDGLRWWQYIGPWPLRPWVGFWGAGAVWLIGGLSAQRDEVTSRPITYGLQIVLPYLLSAAAFGLYLRLFARVFPKRTPRHLITYLVVILGGVLIATVVSYVLNREFGLSDAPEVRNLPFLSIRIWLWSIFLLAVAGLTVRRLSQQTEIAEQALAVSLEQQSLMLVNEERSRRQIAMLLHDRVQAGLMTVGHESMRSLPDSTIFVEWTCVMQRAPSALISPTSTCTPLFKSSPASMSQGCVPTLTYR